MNANYLIYQAERPRSAAWQREEDRLAGETAAAITGLWHSATRPVLRAKHLAVRSIHHPQPACNG
jgi:hypothetical protein